MPILRVSHLSYCFPDGSCGLDDVSLAVDHGEFVLITGVNGSGKTTLLRHLNGLLKPVSGNVCVDSVPVARDLRAARKKVGIVFQDAESQIVGDTVYDDIAFGPENLRLKRQEIDRRVKKALVDVGLEGFEEKAPHNLSGGEKRLLAIAGVLAMEPQVLLLDEPFSNLDYRGACMVLEKTVSLHRAGHTIIITTHDLEKVIYHGTRLILMVDGKIVADGPPEKMVHIVEQYGVRPPCSVQLGMGIIPWERER